MIDWSARIDDLCAKLARDYGVDDRLAVEVLLAALVPCPRTGQSWLILETNWHARQLQNAWFSLGESWVPCSLPRIRARFPWREIEAETKEMLDSGNEQLLIEPDYEHYPSWHKNTQTQFILQRSLRIRVRSMRSDDAIRSLDYRQEERMTEELNTLARAVLEDRTQSRPANPPKFREPHNFLYHCELIERMAPWYSDWHTLLRAFGWLAVRHAYLFGREYTDEEDDLAIARVAMDSIPPWITKALRLLLESDSKALTVYNIMGLEEWSHRTQHGAHREIRRLRVKRIVEWHRHKLEWGISKNVREGVSDILSGRAFGATPAIEKRANAHLPIVKNFSRTG